MRFTIILMTLTVFLAGIAVAQTETQPAKDPACRLDILVTGMQRQDMLRINTGRKAMMADGQRNTVYGHLKPKPGNIFLEIKVDLAVDPGPLFLETSMIQLDEPTRRSGEARVPVYWVQDAGPEPARADTLTVAHQAGLIFTFEVPIVQVDRLALWIAGLRVATIPEIKDRFRAEGNEQ